MPDPTYVTIPDLTAATDSSINDNLLLEAAIPDGGGYVSRKVTKGQLVSDLKEDIGDLSNLETTDKSNLVAAINEAAQSGGGGGVTEDIKQALLACFENVAWDGVDGRNYIDALEEALYPPANLLSISAVYTQSGTVTDWDTLDDLKSDLVVTAHFENGTSETVANYALSGSLVAPSSEITVSYGGKTTSFTVVVTHSDLPSGYTKYDYLTQTLSFGTNHKDYTIVTDAHINSENTIEAKVSYASNLGSDIGWNPLLGSRAGSSNYMVALYGSYNQLLTKWNVFGTEKQATGNANKWAKDVPNTVKLLPVGKSTTYSSDNVFVTNGSEWDTGLSVIDTDTLNWFGIFGYAVSASGAQTSSVYFKGEQIGEIIIYDSDDNVVYHFIPAKDSNGRYGYYETVNNKFHYNATYASTAYTGGYWSVS